MPESLAEILRELIAREGHDLAEDRSRLEAELRARAPEDGRAVHILLVARDAGVPERLRRLEGRADAADLEASAADLVERFGVAECFARTAVETWAEALRPPVSDAPVARRPDAEGGADASSDRPPEDIGPAPSTEPGTERRHAEEQPQAASRSTHDRGVFFETPASRIPQDDDVGSFGAGSHAAETFRLDLELLGERPVPPPSGGGRVSADIPALPTTESFAAAPSIGQAPTQPPADNSDSARPTRSVLRPALLCVAAAVLAACGVGAYYILGGETSSSQPRTASTVPPVPAAATPAVTPEGYPVVAMTNRPAVPARAIEGRPDTLLVTFGVRQGAEVLTYQAAADFSRGDEAGTGLLRVFRNGAESATEPKRIVRRPEGEGYRGFTLSGVLAGPVAAPNLCVSVLTRDPGRETGPRLLCAFAARSDGTCAAETPLGCADLRP